MKRYIISRLIQLVPILIGITFLTFGMMQFAADDAVDIIYEQSGSVSEEIKGGLDIVYVSDMKEVLENSLVED